MTVTEVCLEVGYSSLGSFSTKFQSLVGVPPTQYQRQVQAGLRLPAAVEDHAGSSLLFFRLRRVTARIEKRRPGSLD